MDFTQFDRLISLASGGAAPNKATVISLDGKSVAILVESYGAGAFRLRLNPIAKPDYRLIVADAEPAATERGESSLTIKSGRATLTLASDASHALHVTLQHKGRQILASITDEQFRGMAEIGLQRLGAPAFLRRYARGRLVHRLLLGHRPASVRGENGAVAED